MPNPYQPTVSVSKRDVDNVPAPTLDLDPSVGPELQQELPAAPESGEAVPAGTIKEILDWVGGDKTRAEQAAKHEKASDDPRPTLIYKLQKVREA